MNLTRRRQRISYLHPAYNLQLQTLLLANGERSV